jgi:hypothetical protein
MQVGIAQVKMPAGHIDVNFFTNGSS